MNYIIIGIIIIGAIVSGIYKVLGGQKNESRSNSENEKTSENVPEYYVFDEGSRRELTFIERKTDYDSDPPYYGEYYNRFKDELGRIWRSYDGNKTFL